MDAEIKEYVEGRLKDLVYQIKDIRENTSPFNIEQLHTQVTSLDNRTLTMNDRLKRIEGMVKLDKEGQETIPKEIIPNPVAQQAVTQILKNITKEMHPDHTFVAKTEAEIPKTTGQIVRAETKKIGRPKKNA